MAAALATIALAREFLSTGTPPRKWEWLDDEGREIHPGDTMPGPSMLRLVKHVGDRIVALRVAAEDLDQLVDLLPEEVRN